MKRHFTVKPKNIIAAETDVEDAVDSRLDQASELQDRIEDDFDYIISGLERLGRDGDIGRAISIMQKLADTFDDAIATIGSNFESDEEML